MSLKKGIFISFAKSGGAFVLQFISNIVLARLLLPSEIGIFSVALAALGILQALREFGVGRYIIKEQDLTDAKVKTVFGTAIIIGWSLAALIFFARNVISDFYSEPAISGILALLSINFLMLPFGQPALALLRREKRYGHSAVVTLVAAAISSVVAVVCAYLGSGPMALAYGALVNSAITVVLALALRPDHILMLPSLSEWRSVWRFGVMASGTNLVVEASISMPDLIIGRVLGFAPVGFYSRGFGLAMIFERFFANSFNWVLGPELAALKREGKKLTALVTKTTDMTAVVGWPVLAFLAFKSHAVVLLLYGENWLPAVPILQALCVARGIQLLASAVHAVYEATGDIKLQLRNELMLQTVSIGLIMLGVWHSLEAVAWLRVVLAVFVVAVQFTVFRLHAHIVISQMIRELWRPAAVAGLFAAVLGILVMLEPVSTEPTAIITAFLGEALIMTLVYVLALRLFRHALYGYVKEALIVLADKVTKIRLYSK